MVLVCWLSESTGVILFWIVRCSFTSCLFSPVLAALPKDAPVFLIALSVFFIPTTSPFPVNIPDSVVILDGERIFSELLIDADAALAMLLAVAITDPRMEFIPLTSPAIIFIPALYRLMDANAERIPKAELLAADVACAPPTLTAATS